MSYSACTIRAASFGDSLAGSMMSVVNASWTSAVASDERFCSGCDPAIRLLPRTQGDGKLERLLTEYVFPCCTSGVAGSGADAIKAFDDLAERPLIEYDGGLEPLDANWRVWTKPMGLADVAPKQWLRVPDWHAVFDAAVQGIGVCLGRTPQVDDHLRAGILVAPTPEVLVSTRANYLLRAPGSDADPTVRHFLDWLTSEASNESRFQESFLKGKRLVDPTSPA